jgi:hypothetical protein
LRQQLELDIELSGRHLDRVERSDWCNDDERCEF